MANTDITLRLDKGSSLTFNEMDTNFASFFYSASTHIVGGANKLRLFYTGSGQLDAPFNTERYTELALPTATTTSGGGSATAAGNEREIQFNNGSCNFGASSQLKFLQSNSTGARLGVGLTPKTTLDIASSNSNQPTIFNLNASSTTTNTSAKAFIQFRQGGSTFAQLGKRNSGNNIIDFFVKNQLNLGTHNYGSPTEIFRKLNVSTGGVVVGENLESTIAPGTAPLAVVGEIGVGSDVTVGNTNFIGGNTVESSYLPNNSVNNGLLIQSPKSTNGGHVVIGINTKTSGTAESFSIVKGSCGTFNSSVATFKADGKVGIGCVNPANTLDVDGDTLIVGNLTAAGTATIQTVAELASLDTDWSNSSDEYARTLVKTEDGLVQYMDAAPIPKGGIIMWAGAVNNIPKGWRLCDGSNENGVTVPDLRERFIVGAGGKNVTHPVGGSPLDGHNVNDTGGKRTHNHNNGKTGEHALTINQMPSHNHVNDNYLSGRFRYLAGWSRSSAATGIPSGWETVTADDNNDGGTPEMFIDASNTNRVDQTEIQSEGGGKKHCHSIASANHMPPYYALAFIIYVGVA